MTSAMAGKYILRQTDLNYWEILKAVNPEESIYQTVIPNAGYSKGFAVELLNTLNSQGSEASNA